MSNFEFLKKLDKDLFNIINDAEKLYRDEYFEQCMGQTRRFGENVCKNLSGTVCNSSFDEMLATLKDKIKSEQEKEFIDDLYFLKKQGNVSVHSKSVKQDGILALECLQRAFEVALNYAVHYKKGNSNLLKLQYDIDLLVKGEKKKQSLSQKYNEEKKKTSKSKSESQEKPVKKQYHTMKTKKQSEKKGLSVFQIFWLISFSVASAITLFIVLLAAN